MVSALDFFFSSQRIRAPGKQELPSAPGFRDVARFDFDSTNTNQFIVDNLTTANPAHNIFDYGDIPLSNVGSNRTVLPASSHCSAMGTLSQVSVSTIPTEGNPWLPSDLGESNQNEHGRLNLFGDVEYLASLPHSVLKDLSKNIAEVLTAKQARKESVASRGENGLQLDGERAACGTASGSNTINDVLKCEYPGCTTTFRRNKDRLRHFRNKHKSNTKTFPCPVVNCPSGLGHKFHRSDKLRDHLRTEKILKLIHWSCVIPGCSEILGDRAGLIDHLGQHDYITRGSNQKLLMDYGFASRHWQGYLGARYICSIPGCPFGTDNEDIMDAHLLIPHQGPFCPCPIPSCQRVSQDYDSASTHLGLEHDYDTRQCFYFEIYRHFDSHYNIFLCPICHNKIKPACERDSSARLHCQKHDYQELLPASNALMKAWTFAFGPITHGRNELRITGDMILPYIILPNKELEKLLTKADFEQAIARIRAAIELSTNT